MSTISFGDSWSLGLIAKEVTTIYSELLSGTYIEKNYPSYLDYIQAEETYLQSDKYQKDKLYWDTQFQTIPEIASLSVRQAKEKEITCAGARAKFSFSAEDLAEVRAFCDSHKISVYNFFIAVYSFYVSRVSNLSDFVIGTPILNRTNFDQKHTMGMFINVAPLRVAVNEQVSFVDFAKHISVDTMSIFRHQRYSYQTVLEDIRKRDASIPNLYNVVLSYQITKTTEESNHIHYSTDWIFNGNASDELQIHMFDLNEASNMTVAYDYKTSAFSADEVASIHHRIVTIMKQVISDEAVLLQELEIVTPEEKTQILADFNDTFVDYPRNQTIVDLFEKQVEKTPNEIAVVFEDQKLTYRELNEKANALAKVLLQKNVQVGDIVAIYLHKSLEVVVSMFAILKAGAAFLPLDTDYPKDRLDYILQNSTPKLILSSKDLAPDLSLPLLLVDLAEDFYTTQEKNNLHLALTPENLMYVMYTSGSTGNPKGVMVKHKNIIRLAAFPNFITFAEKEVMVQTGTIVFDACIFEIFGCLLHGFSLHILKKEFLLDTFSFADFLEKQKVTILFLTTGLFNQFGLQHPSMFQHLNYLLTGGDVISKESMQKILACNPKLKIINCYGPTENGSYSTCYPIHGDEKIIPIGKPITNSTVYVVQQNHLCPVGVPGELWVGGDGLAKGYFHRPDLTQQQFISNPFGEGMLYKTGDLVKWLPDGNLEFLGRIDNQVKVRGFRIELSEIDRKILLDTSIKQSLTVVKNIHQSKVICSYLVSDREISIKDLKATLAKSLPSYMIPAFIMQLPAFPLNINGKTDVKAFPLPDETNLRKEIVPARNELDTLLIHTLEKVLQITNISLADSFFELGGDSLSAISFTLFLSQDLGLQITVNDVFHYPVLQDLSDYIATLSKETITSAIKPASKREYYPTSNAQRRIYYASSMEQNSILYNTAGGIIVDKVLDIPLLQKCFQTLITRHEVLRTRFCMMAENIVQVVEDHVDFTLSYEKQIVTDDFHTIYTNFVKPFDLSSAPLLRAKVVALPENKMLLLLDMHHIISDGTSLSILLQELCDLYNGKILPEKQIGYKDFSLWEREQLKTEEYQQAKDFWVSQFESEIPLLNMPTTFPRPSLQSFEGANYYTNLSSEMFEKINIVAKQLGITPYMFMLSAFYILLSKYTSQDDIVIGTPVANRELPELSQMIGMFVNTLALRNKVDHSICFADFTKQIKDYCLSAFANQAYPFDELVKALNVKRDPSRNPLFDVMFIYQNNGYPTIHFDDTQAEYFIPNGNVSKFDLSLEIIPTEKQFSLRFEYGTKLFSEDFIQKFANHYINVLTTILENTAIKIADIDLLSPEERIQILQNFNATDLALPEKKSIVDLLEEQVEKTPDRIALVFENQKLTYREFNEKANALARFLVEQGISRNSIVGIMLPRSLEMMISIFAILKSGAAYLPIDPTYPKNRITYIVKDSNLKILLTKDNSLFLKNIDTIDVSLKTSKIYDTYGKQNLKLSILPEDLSYIIYTSGSTGNPKGVKLKHLSLLNLVYHCNNYVEYLKNNSYRSVVSITTVSFDIFIFETLISLQRGLKLVIANEREKDVPALLDQLIEKEKIEIIQTTPSRMQIFCSNLQDMPHFHNLKFITLAGEQLPISLAKSLKAATDCTIYNGYGPSETTVFSTLTDVTNKDFMTIGKPLANTQIYILNPDHQACPVGVPGEICISGNGVGYGYIGKDDLTQKSFIPNPFLPSSTLYRTGDLGYYQENGEIVCLGRIDHQIKIRGLRIELDEIEKIILSFKGIEKVVVTTSTGSLNRQILCAYFIAKSRVSISELKQYIAMFLPNYMVPTYIAQLADFKYTPNGKVDKKALPEPTFANEKKYYKAPKTNTEYMLLQIWESLLCISPISTSDNFFDIGGDSLLAIKMQMELLRQNINISYAEIFKYNTIHSLAAMIDKTLNITDDLPNLFDLYDYSNIDHLLQENIRRNLTNLSVQPIGNVLLTGVTGFLGIHLLAYLLENTDVKIYCLIRKDPSTSLVDKILRKLHYYFGEKYDAFVQKRIIAINSDLSKNNLGLTSEKLSTLSEQISCVINCAAIVKHYGNYKDFEKINVIAVKKLVDFCKKYHKKLVQISTLSVSGNTMFDFAMNQQKYDTNVTFNESNLYIGQSLENVYVRSKFEAEKIILTEVYQKKLDALILRIGNITNRFSDGKFQQNASENAFANKIKAFMEIAALPDYVMDKYMEFSPVDCVAEAVIKAIEHADTNVSVLHIYNPNHVYLKDFVQLLPPQYALAVVQEKEFKNIIDNLLKNDEKRYIISNILNDLDSERKLVYDTQINIQSKFSQNFLKQSNFTWPTITKEYIENLLKNL